MRRLLGLVLLIGLIATGVASADEITIQGSTAGCFDSAGPCSSGANSLGGLTFSSANFGPQTTNAGFTSFSNLGVFSLSSEPYAYNGHTFTLNITFSLPTGVNGPSPAAYSASLLGSVSTTATGGVAIIFDNPSQTFTFSNDQGSGSFTFVVNNVSPNIGGSNLLSGYVYSATQSVPEPASMLMLGGGLLGIGGLKLRRKLGL